MDNSARKSRDLLHLGAGADITGLLAKHELSDPIAIDSPAIHSAWINAAQSQMAQPTIETSSNYDESATALLRAAELEVRSEHALNYLGATQMDTDSEPLPKAIEAVCSRADSHPEELVPATWCGALLFRKGDLSGGQKSSDIAIARLQHAIALAPRDPVANCVLGRAYAWTDLPRRAGG